MERAGTAVDDRENRVLGDGRKPLSGGEPDGLSDFRIVSAYFAFGRCNERIVIGLLMSMN